MIKKTALLCAIATSIAMHADIILDTQLLISKDAYQRNIQRIIHFSDENNVIRMEDIAENIHVLECAIIAYEEDGVIVQFKGFDVDNNEIAVSEPIKCVWDNESIIEIDRKEDDQETIQLSIIASRS